MTLFPFSTFLHKSFTLLGIRDKCFDFISKLYLTSKARARYFDMLSNEFPIHCGVRQGCPLSPILFNLFINDILKTIVINMVLVLVIKNVVVVFLLMILFS